jgi:hypothetical protein
MRNYLCLLLLVLVPCAGCDSKSTDDVDTSADKTGNAAVAKTETTPELDPSSPKGVVTAYYAAVKAGDLEKAYALVSSGDRGARTLEQYQAGASDPTQRAVNAARKFKVGEAKVEGDTARVYVDVDGPDLSLIQRKMLAKYINSGDKVPATDELQSQLRKEVANPDAPRATSHVEVVLIRDEGKWRLDFDWDKKRPERAVPEKRRQPQPERTKENAPKFNE